MTDHTVGRISFSPGGYRPLEDIAEDILSGRIQLATKQPDPRGAEIERLRAALRGFLRAMERAPAETQIAFGPQIDAAQAALVRPPSRP